MRHEGRKEGWEEGESVQKKADMRIEERGKGGTREEQGKGKGGIRTGQGKDKRETKTEQRRDNIYRLLQKSR